MKKLLVGILLLGLSGQVQAVETSKRTKSDKETYQAIKTLLDNGSIDIETAQKLWKERKK